MPKKSATPAAAPAATSPATIPGAPGVPEAVQPEETNAVNSWMKKFISFARENALVRVLRGMVSGLAIGDSRKLTVAVDGKGDSYTDGKTIVISMPEMFLNEESRKHWPVILRALLAHEVSHVNHSDFQYVSEIRDWYEKEMVSYGFDGRIGRTVASDFLNMFEDGRIEELAIEEHRGLLAAFRFLNNAIRKGCAIKEKAENAESEFRDFSGVILSYAKTGLLPDGVEAYSGEEMETYVIPSLHYIDDAIKEDAKGCYEEVKAFLTDIAPYLEKLLKNSPQLQQKLQEQAEQNEYSGVGGGDGAKAKASGGEDGEGTLRANASGKFQGVVEGNGPDTGISDGQGSDLSFAKAGNGQQEDQGYTEEQILQMEAAFASDVQNAKAQEIKEQGEENQEDGPSQEEINKMLAQAYGKGNSGFHIRWPTIEPQALPPDIVSEARILRKEILKVMESRNGARYGVKSGYLDPRSLWRTSVGDNDVFYRPAVEKSDCAFYILMDLSGSMSESVGRNATKSFVARRTAAVIEEVSRGLFPTKIALYNTSFGGADHICIKPFEAKGTTNFSYSSLSTLGPNGCNEDSVHIRTAALELAKRKEQRKFLFVLSDGLPSAYASRTSAEQEVRKAVDEAQSKGIVVIPIMFGDPSYMNSCMKSYKEMYPKNLIVCEPKEISKRLPLLFRQLVLNR